MDSFSISQRIKVCVRVFFFPHCTKQNESLREQIQLLFGAYYFITTVLQRGNLSLVNLTHHYEVYVLLQKEPD